MSSSPGKRPVTVIGTVTANQDQTFKVAHDSIAQASAMIAGYYHGLGDMPESLKESLTQAFAKEINTAIQLGIEKGKAQGAPKR